MAAHVAAALLAAAGAPARASGQDGATQGPGPGGDGLSGLSLEDLMKVQVSPFAVSRHLDLRYRASNSVSASRIDTPIADLPFAIQAFTTQFIADQRPEGLHDVVRYAPGVTYRSNDFNEGNANVAIRGFAVGNKPGDAQVLRDGLRGPSILDLTNVERVEVAKGPASFLYGQLAPGGVVNVITKRPEPDFAASLAVATGSYGSYRLDADVTGPAAPRGLLYRLAASYREDLHYWRPYDAHQWDLAPTVTWRPAARTSLTLGYEGFRKREAPQVMQKPGYGTWGGTVPTPEDPNLQTVAVPGLPRDWNSMADGDHRDSDTDAVTLSLETALGDHWDARARYGYQGYRIGALATGNFGVSNGSFVQGRRVRRQVYVNDFDTFEAEVTGRFRFAAGPLGAVSLRLLAGGQYVASRFHRWAAQAPNDPAYGTTPASPLPPWDLRDPSTWDRRNDVPLSSLTEARLDEFVLAHDRAAYGGVTLGVLGDRLLVLAGGRYTRTTAQFTQLGVLTIPETAASRFTPQLGLLGKPLPGVSVFAAYATSFVPNPKELQVRNVYTGRFARPTEGEGIDVGVKAELLGGRVSGTVTLFQVTNEHILRDSTELDPGSGAQVFTTTQSGRERSRGVEVDATLSPARDWQIVLSYTYMDARILEFTGRDDELLARDWQTLDAAERANYKDALRFHDAPLQMSAPHLANLWTRWDVPSGPLRGLYLAGGVNLVVDQTFAPDTPEDHHQTYALLGALAGYRWRWGGVPVSLDVWGKNLADREYRPSQSTRARPRELAGTLTVAY